MSSFSILLSIISSRFVFFFSGCLLFSTTAGLRLKSLPLFLSCLSKVRSELLAYWWLPSPMAFVVLPDSFVAFFNWPTMELSWRILELGATLLLIAKVIFM